MSFGYIQPATIILLTMITHYFGVLVAYICQGGIVKYQCGAMSNVLSIRW